MSPRLSWTSGVAPRLLCLFQNDSVGADHADVLDPGLRDRAHDTAHHVQGEPRPGAGIEDRGQTALGAPQVLDRHDRGYAGSLAQRATIPAPNSSVSDARRARSSASRITDSVTRTRIPRASMPARSPLVDPVDDHPVDQALIHPGHARGRDLVAERGEHPVRRTLERPSADDRADGHLRGGGRGQGLHHSWQGQDRADAHDRVRRTEDDGVGAADRREDTFRRPGLLDTAQTRSRAPRLSARGARSTPGTRGGLQGSRAPSRQDRRSSAARRSRRPEHRIARP